MSAIDSSPLLAAGKTGATAAYVEASADMEGPYRYRLTRIWDHSLPNVLFVMLNPSTADETQDDPTLKKIVRFAQSWGCGGVTVANLYALRLTDPTTLLAHPAPIGPRNNEVLRHELTTATRTIAAWGNIAHSNRIQEIHSLGGRWEALKINKTGQPSHPLYLSSSTAPVPWWPGKRS